MTTVQVQVMRRFPWVLWLAAVGLCVDAAPALAQSTYHLHREASTTSGLFQVRTTGPDVAAFAIQSANLSNQPAGQYLAKAFDTQSGVPGTVGTLPSGSVLTFTVWMRKTANAGTMFPLAQVRRNNAAGTALCPGTGAVGATALTTTLTSYTLTCTTTSAIAFVATDRLYVWTGVNVTVGPGSTTVRAEVRVEGTLNGNANSRVVVPALAPPAPTVSSLVPTSGIAGQAIIVNGTNFGASQGASTVTFGGVAASVSGWTATAVTAVVPPTASTGSVVVTVGGQPSNGVSFTTIPSVASATPSPAAVGQAVTIAGGNFGATQGGSTVRFNGVTATPTSWSATSIATPVPTGATTGSLIVTVGGQPSAGVSFPVRPGITSLTPSLGATGTAVTIAGTTFGAIQGASTVTFNGTSATVTTWGDTSIAVTVPVGAASGPVVVTTSAGASAGSPFVVPGPVSYSYDALGRLVGAVDSAGATAIYVYDAVGNLVAIQRPAAGVVSVAALAPTGGPVGATVTIAGSGFSTVPAQNTVSFNGTAATVVASTPTQITAMVPPGATTGVVAVTTPSGTASSSGPFTVSVLTAPTIATVGPPVGTVGTVVTVTGTGFSTTVTDDRVRLNASYAQPSGTPTTTTLTFPIPPAAGSGRVTLSTPLGSAVSTTDVFVPPPPFLPADLVAMQRTTIGTAATVTVGTTNGIGLLLFDGLEGQRITVTATNGLFGQTVGCDVFLTIVRPDNGYNGLADCAEISGFVDRQTLPNTGTYAVLVDPFQIATGSVTLLVQTVPPDLTGSIVAGGAPVTVTTTAPGQNAILTFTGAAGQRIFVAASNGPYGPSLGCDWYTTVMRPDTVPLAQACTEFSGFIDTLTLPTTGAYTLFVDPAGPAVGSLTLTLYTVPPDVTGPIVAGGGPVVVTMATPGQNAALTFSGTAGQRISLAASNGASGPTLGCDWWASILKPDTTALVSGVCVEGSGFVDVVTLPVSGTYTIAIDPVDVSTGSLTLTLLSVPADVTGTITAGGAPVVVTLTAPGQNAALTFSGTAGQRISLQASNGSSGPTIGCDWWASITRPDTTTLVSPTCIEGSGFVDVLVLPTTGTYTLTVDPSGAAIGSVTLTLYNVPADVTGTLSPGVPFALSVDVPGRNAVLDLAGTAAQRVSVLTTVTSGSYGCVWSMVLRNPGGSTLSSLSLCGASGFQEPIALPTTGTYSLLINPNGAGTGNATVTPYTVTDVTGSIVPNGGGVPVAVTTPGQRALLTFAGTAGQVVSAGVTVSSGSFGCVWSLGVLKPDGSTLQSGFQCGSPGTLNAVTLPTAGTYTLLINPGAASTGSGTVTLTTP